MWTALSLCKMAKKIENALTRELGNQLKYALCNKLTSRERIRTFRDQFGYTIKNYEEQPSSLTINEVIINRIFERCY
jgi:hypothetical protein